MVDGFKLCVCPQQLVRYMLHFSTANRHSSPRNPCQTHTFHRSLNLKHIYSMQNENKSARGSTLTGQIMYITCQTTDQSHSDMIKSSSTQLALQSRATFLGTLFERVVASIVPLLYRLVAHCFLLGRQHIQLQLGHCHRNCSTLGFLSCIKKHD